MLALQGKGILAPYSDVLAVLMDTVMAIHDINSKKHPFMSWQKYPEKSDALPINSLHAVYRHTLAFMANKTQDEYASHMESIACRLWMFVGAYYRCNNHSYILQEHTYVRLAEKEPIIDTITKYNNMFPKLPKIAMDYVHFAAEPLISLYKTFNNKEIMVEDTSVLQRVLSENERMAKYTYHFQMYQTILHSVLLDHRYEEAVTNDDLLIDITIVDLLLYHFTWAYYYFFTTDIPLTFK